MGFENNVQCPCIKSTTVEGKMSNLAKEILIVFY